MYHIMFDTQVFDKLPTSTIFERLQKLVEDAKIMICLTHVQVDEIGAIPDNKSTWRKHLLRLMFALRPKLIPTRVMIVGESAIGMARIANEEDIRYIELLRNNRREGNPSRDALIAYTALLDMDIYVTDDEVQTTRANNIPTRKAKIMNFEQFKTWVEQQ